MKFGFLILLTRVKASSYIYMSPIYEPYASQYTLHDNARATKQTEAYELSNDAWNGLGIYTKPERAEITRDVYSKLEYD